MEALCNNNTIPELPKSEQEMCEEVITEKECYESLSSFTNNKNPGNDSLTKEFYVAFWKKDF